MLRGEDNGDAPLSLLTYAGLWVPAIARVSAGVLNGGHRTHYYQELGLARGWVYERFMTVRNFLADLDVLECVDNRYTPSTPDVTGFPLRWRVNAARLVELLEACAARNKDVAGSPGQHTAPPHQFSIILVLIHVPGKAVPFSL